MPRPEPLTERNRRIARYWAMGRTMYWIAQAVGISRQRVSVILERPLRAGNLEHPAYRKRALRLRLGLERLERYPAIRTMPAFAKLLGVSPKTLRRAVKQQGLQRLVHGEFRRRRKEVTRDRIRRDYILLARRLGRTPSIGDCDVEWGVSRTKWIILCFGTIRSLQVAAGLPPNRKGGFRPPPVRGIRP